MHIGLLLVNEEDDVLADTLTRHCDYVDVFYALDGTADNTYSKSVITSADKCARYTTDAELDGPVRDGTRQVLYDQAVGDYGYDHWFLLLHADEVWTCDPRWLTEAYPAVDGYGFRCPFYFPRQGEPWDYDKSALSQLHWHYAPGWPEFRMFKGGPDVAYDTTQHSSTQPAGLVNVVWTREPIRHYPYRSPESQRARAAAHLRSGFDLSNYQHVLDHDAVYWDDDRIAAARCAHHTEVCS